jgi:ankyrin repeat protein
MRSRAGNRCPGSLREACAQTNTGHSKRKNKIRLNSQMFTDVRLATNSPASERVLQSWTALKRLSMEGSDRDTRLKTWLQWAYEGNARERSFAIDMLREEPDFFNGDAWLACAIGDESTVQRNLSDDVSWANRAGGVLGMPPLVAVTHSLLILDPAFESPLLACARALLQQGADVNSSWVNAKWPDYPQSALYGAAGRTHHAGMTKLLLEAGANPNDNESLYHSVESRDSTCTRLLLEAGARVVGTNAIGRVLDYDKLGDLQLLLQHGGDAREQPWIHHAILRGRSLAHMQMLVDAGADLRATDGDGISLYRWAQMHGRTDVVQILRNAGIEESLTPAEQFVAACAQGDAAAARAIQERVPDIFSRLAEKQLQVMPQHAANGDMRGVRAMLDVGWPLEVKTAWDATALNLAVYRGDARMTELLLKRGADWRTMHGFGGNVLGTLSHASQDDVEDPAPRDYLGCARALVAYGVPVPRDDHTFSPELAEYFETVRSRTS